VMENEGVLPRAFVPRHTRAGEMNPDADFADSAWIDGAGDAPNGPGVVAVAREGSALRMQASMDAPGWVVVSETAWPGWRAYLDGRPHPTPRPNHALRARRARDR